MKIYRKILALCVFHPTVWGTTAFFVQTPKALTFKGHAWQTPNAQPSVVLHAIPYLGDLFGKVSEKAASTQNPDMFFANTAPQTRGSPWQQQRAKATQTDDTHFSKNVWDTSTPSRVQGDSLRTWSFSDPSVERVQVLMKTVGRPLSATVELWHGPNNTPLKMRVYIDDGSLRPFSAVIETPKGQNAIAIRNTGSVEFPLSACVEGDDSGRLVAVTKRLSNMSISKRIQGGGIQTYPFAPGVASVQVSLSSDGRPLNARIELLQGPNNNKQVVEIYTENGLTRPLFMVIETPETGNVVRIVNTGDVAFPMTASVEPYMVEPGYSHKSITTKPYRASPSSSRESTTTRNGSGFESTTTRNGSGLESWWDR